MKKHFLLIFFCLTIVQVYAQKNKVSFHQLDIHRGLYFQRNTMAPFTGVAVDYYNKKKKRVEIHFKDGKLNGLSSEWAKNGKKVLETNYQNGLQEGMEKNWYASGKKKTELNYSNGKANGVFKEWYEDGQLKTQGKYINGLEEGEHQWLYDNGTNEMTIPYTRGQANGIIKAWYKGGQRKFEKHFVNGQEEGPSIEWFENGIKKSEGSYTNGQVDGETKLWSKAGILQEKAIYQQGKMIQEFNYRSGHIKTKKGYLEIFNELESFFTIEVVGNEVYSRDVDYITYSVDGKLLRIFTTPINRYSKLQSGASQKDLLEEYLAYESGQIKGGTEFDIKVEKELLQTSSGIPYLHWQFVSPSSQDEDQKPRTVQKEHYISVICNQEVLSLYGVVTNSDTPAEVTKMLHQIIETVKVEKERIDLNALADKAYNEQ